MNSKKAKAVRLLAEMEIQKFEEANQRKVTPEERRKFYKYLKRRSS